MIRQACATLALVFAVGSSATAQVGLATGFSVDGPTIRLHGPIELDAEREFADLLRANPQVTEITLSSPGGKVVAALAIARLVKTSGLSTSVPLGSECYSACSIIFLAGAERVSDGRLGVHQISGTDDPSLTQSVIGQIYEDLVTYETPSYLVARMLRTPPGDMYVFSPEELERHAINLRSSDRPRTIPHLLAVETWLRDDWLVGVFHNTNINQSFVALESRELDPLLRIVFYPHRAQGFFELMYDEDELSGVGSRLEFRFAHGSDEPYSFYFDADIEPNAYAFDMPTDPDQSGLFWAAFTSGTDLTVLNPYGIEIATYGLNGSRQAFDDFATIVNR